MKNKLNHPHTKIIDQFGGTNKMAEICKVSAPTVSYWREHGIPELRLENLKLRFRSNKELQAL